MPVGDAAGWIVKASLPPLPAWGNALMTLHRVGCSIIGVVRPVAVLTHGPRIQRVRIIPRLDAW